MTKPSTPSSSPAPAKRPAVPKELRFHEQNGTIFVEFVKALDLTGLNADVIDLGLKQSEYSKAKIFDGAIPSALAEGRRYRHDAPTSQQNLRYKIAELRDAELTVKISDDFMEAEAHAIAPYGGKALNKSQILHALRDSGITAGIRREAIELLLEHTAAALPGLPIDTVIARGRQPMHGLNARFKKLVPDARERVLRPQERGDGTVDMRDLGKLVSVKAGTPILKKLPATKGRAGFTVTGEALPANDGEDKPISAGDGTQIDPRNPDILLADKHGMPSFNDNTASVDEVLTMENVDVSTGHVDYDGNVIITGSVAESMRVKATGDITVAGYVDSAELNAGGNITVAKGVIGHQLNIDDEDDDENFAPLSTRLIAAGSVWVSYAQYSMLVGRAGVLVDKQATHCHIISQGAVCIGGEGKNATGKLIGGVIETTADVATGQMGAPAGTKTRVYFQRPVAASDQEVELNTLTHQLQQNLQLRKKLTHARVQLEQLPQRNERQQQMLATVKREFEQLEYTLSAVSERIRILKAEPPPPLILTLVVSRTMFPGSIVRFEDQFMRIRERRGGSVVALMGTELILDVLR